MSPEEVSARVREFNLKPTVSGQQLYDAVNRISDATVPIAELPEDIRETIATLKPAIRSFHGAKMSLAWFTLLPLASPCADKFGYMSSWLMRAATRLQFTPANQALLNTLGDLMADLGRETSPDSVNPAGFTYVGQFIDHDITLDVSSPPRRRDRCRDHSQHTDAGARPRFAVRRRTSDAAIPLRLSRCRSLDGNQI
ncbi:hypothetical protein [Rhizobium leguminosarum]|uniref:hypothetical protein n=1 Tax=Rhizobium leguminosarum TaxID=384 RepID=UPI001FEFF3EF|nr:hypothetical protein [Rhizobium leguminosarum]